MLVRVADCGDVDELLRLRSVWRNVDTDRAFASAFRDWFRTEEPTRWWWLATDGGVGVGMVNVKLFARMPSPKAVPSRWGYLANLFVVPGSRGQGIGSELVRCALGRAREDGLARVVLSPSERSHPLYVRLGFRSADELLVHPLRD